MKKIRFKKLLTVNRLLSTGLLVMVYVQASTLYGDSPKMARDPGAKTIESKPEARKPSTKKYSPGNGALNLKLSDSVGPKPIGSGIVADLKVSGNKKVEADAIINTIKLKKGGTWNEGVVASDIKSLFALGYFSDIRFLKEDGPSGSSITIQVVEKPSVVAVKFEGLSEMSEDDFKDKISTKIYTIVDDLTLSKDAALIEKAYSEKGFYLADVKTDLRKVNDSEVEVVFVVNESAKVLVGDVDIVGNKFFSDSELLEKMATRPITRASNLSSSSFYQDDFVKRDLEFLSYWYQDWGFAEVKVGKPISRLDLDRKHARVIFSLEEGIQFKVAEIKFSGDVLFPEAELAAGMVLKTGELFRLSRLQKDVEYLIDRYGDLGFAFVDVNPKTTFNRKDQTVSLDFALEKGKKVYFGTIDIVGNDKTRNNVVRRELQIADSELYSGTGMRDSKDNINRLGFFESVQILKERDEKNEEVLDLKVRVKEKATGQLQAAVGYQPASESKASWFGQGRYDERNQSGYGWGTNFTGKWNGSQNYQADTEFTNPRINDSQWSLGLNLGYEQQETTPLQNVTAMEKRISGGVTIGRQVVELIRASISYSWKDVKVLNDIGLIEKFRSDGKRSTLGFRVFRNKLDNFIDPSSGLSTSLSHKLVGGPILGGDYQYMETNFSSTYYLPVEYSDSFKTNFRLNLEFNKLWPWRGQSVPLADRYRLGGYNNIRGFEFGVISPTFLIMRSPWDRPTIFYKGGDRSLLTQLEYFLPLIPEAGIKALFFADAGRVYDDQEDFTFKGLKRDIGVGFRWITPIAPFRFEWAWPVKDDGKLGDMKMIFNIGY